MQDNTVIITTCRVREGQRVEMTHVHLNYGEDAEQRGALVLIHGGRSNKTEAFEELVCISTGRDTWGV